MNYKIGDLYSCASHYLLVFPTEKIVESVLNSGCPFWCHPVGEIDSGNTRDAALYIYRGGEVAANARSQYWEKIFDCNVYYTSRNEIFIIVAKERYTEEISVLKILCCSNKIGWVVVRKNTYLKKEYWS